MHVRLFHVPFILAWIGLMLDVSNENDSEEDERTMHCLLSSPMQHHALCSRNFKLLAVMRERVRVRVCVCVCVCVAWGCVWQATQECKTGLGSWLGRVRV